MAYQTGTFTDSDDLLDILRLFLIAQGWTVNQYVVEGTGYKLCIVKSGTYFALRSMTNEAFFSTRNQTGISVAGATGFDSGATWDAQPGTHVAAGSNVTLYAPMSSCNGSGGIYHMFGLPDSIVVYMDSPNGSDQLMLGKTSEGIQILSAQQSTRSPLPGFADRRFGFLARVPDESEGRMTWAYDDINNEWVRPYESTINYDGVQTTTQHLAHNPVVSSANQLRGNTLFVPSYVSLETVAGARFVGSIEDLYIINREGVQNYDPATYGADQFVVVDCSTGLEVAQAVAAKKN